nr:hypothetical protein [Streptomyces chartreusis]
MCAITVQDRDAGVSSLTLSELRHRRTAKNDVIVEIHTAGFPPASWTGPAPGQP